MATLRAGELVRTLRYRRALGRVKLVRGQTPRAPNIRYSHSYGCLFLLLSIAIVFAALAIIATAVKVAIDLGIAIAVLLLLREFRAWALPVFRGEPFDSRHLAECAPLTTFAMGALPSGALAFTASHEVAPIAAVSVIGGLVFRPLAVALDGQRIPPVNSLLSVGKTSTAATEIPIDVEVAGDFGLWIGEATGTFAKLGHLAGLSAGANVTLDLRDAAKNIAIFGETGTGKTTRVVNHLLVQALDFDAGALIFDVRGDFYETTLRAAELTGKTVQRIGVGHLGINLLEGLTPNTAAGFLEAAFKLLGQGEGDSAFWLSLAVARCQNALGVLNHVAGEYSLRSLYRYVFDNRFRARAIETASDTLLELQVRAADGDREASLDMRRLKSALDYEATIAPGYSDKERSGLNRTIETALARFTDPELEDAFCTAHNAQARIEDVLDGSVFVVNVPRERFKAASRVVYLFLKERFFQALNTRAQMEPGPRKDRPVLFLCDEYQQICSTGDANFFDTSRALGVVGIVASQSIEAYISALGDEYAATALLANFTNIIAFRSTQRTMDYLAGKVGDVDIWKQSYNAGQSSAGFFANTTENDGRSVSNERQRLLNAQLFRVLRPDHAVALLTVNGSAFDDVIQVPQITSDDLTENVKR